MGAFYVLHVQRISVGIMHCQQFSETPGPMSITRDNPGQSGMVGRYACRNDIVSYITTNRTPLVVSENTTMHCRSKDAGTKEWGTQVELHAAMEMYSTSLSQYTLTPTKNSYHWICYSPKTRPVTQKHIELAYPSGVHFDVVVDATTSS